MTTGDADSDHLKAVGIIPQNKDGRYSLRLKLADARLTVPQLWVIAAVAENYGDDTVAVNAWRGLEISGVAVDRLREAVRALQLGGLDLGAARGRITDNRF